MKSTIAFITILVAFFISCKTQKMSSGTVTHPFVSVSQQYPAYFETSDKKTWIPVMINYVVPAGQDEAAAFTTIENYFSNFSRNGGDAMRIWISSPFLEIEDEKAGQYSAAKFARIDKLLQLAEKYQIRIKFTLHHIRSITTGEAKQPWANSAVLSTGKGGPFNNIKEYTATDLGKKYYLDRARALSAHYKNNKQIFAWELWNEMDAAGTKEWFAFTSEILDSVKMLFPRHLVTQTLGSLDSKEGEGRYQEYFGLQNNPFVSLHRYIDPGKDITKYDKTMLPVDSLVYDAVAFARGHVKNKPVVVNEIGAVEANHAGPSKLYAVDSVGVLIHDMVFAPFFCGAAGTGGMWHWDSYVQRQNLWYHYSRFRHAISGIDPVAERFVPFTMQGQGVRSYGLKGKTQTIIWCRNTDNNWKTEFIYQTPAELKTGFQVRLHETGRTNVGKVSLYDPWKDQWSELTMKDGIILLPPFLRSVIVVIK